MICLNTACSLAILPTSSPQVDLERFLYVKCNYIGIHILACYLYFCIGNLGFLVGLIKQWVSVLLICDSMGFMILNCIAPEVRFICEFQENLNFFRTSSHELYSLNAFWFQVRWVHHSATHPGFPVLPFPCDQTCIQYFPVPRNSGILHTGTKSVSRKFFFNNTTRMLILNRI